MFENKEGQAVPQTEFKIIEDGKWKTVTTDDLFKGKNVVVFSLPGAFTPTCSSSHVPRYNDLAGVLKNNGVDDIVCMSVNDTFVMNAWKQDQRAENITFIPDGNGEFTHAMGLLVDKDNLGFGKRSWRYSMLVKDGVIDKMFIEPEKEGDPFEVSDADTMLSYINADAQKPEYTTIFTKAGCPHCTRAKEMLSEHGVRYEEIPLSDTVTSKTLEAVSGRTSTPQIFIGGKHIGGAEELAAYFKG